MSQSKKKPKLLPLDEWVEAFPSLSRAEENAPHGWCIGSLQVHSGTDLVCPHCQQDTSTFPKKEGLQKGQLRPHTRVDIPKGLYLIHVGSVNGHGDWFKIGSSQDMTNRLLDHLRSTSHEYCRVVHMKEHGRNSKTVEGVEGLINGRLRHELSDRLSEEYFPYSETAVQRCKALMDDPSLLLPDLFDSAA